MELVASVSAPLTVLQTTTSPSRTTFISNSPAPRKSLLSSSSDSISRNYKANHHQCIKRNRLAPRVHPVTHVSAAAVTSDVAAQVEITWQIIVGALAGVTPFIVAGIAFGKRIVAQRKCSVCGGSGLVLREKDYLRCPACGGFLPWQSWKRFFTG